MYECMMFVSVYLCQFFKRTETLKCDGFPGPGVAASHVLVDPINELVHRNDKHFSPMFEDYKQMHKKNYKSDEEHSQREHNFRHNIRSVSPASL